MNQLTFQFPFKTVYEKKDFYVSSNNFEAYKLIESWPKWPNKFLNIYGPSGSGKTYLSQILKTKINSIIINAETIEKILEKNINELDCVIIDNYENNIKNEILYSFINTCIQLDIYLMIISTKPLQSLDIKLVDLKSRFKSFLSLGISLPTDDLLKVIITKYFSDNQIQIDSKILEYIIKNIDRSYYNVFKFIKEIDKESLRSGKSISIKLVKKVLKNEHI